jgi:alpha-1,2-mannosyltransferase
MTPQKLILIVLAAIGTTFMLVDAVTRWGTPADENAYWLAAHRLMDGLPLYDPTATSITPFAYWYPPIVAQVLSPVVAVLSADLFNWLWTFLMLGCLWWLAGRNLLVALAMCAFPPIAVEFWFRNVHLVLAVLLVLGLRRWGGWHSVGAAIKLAPVLGIGYLVLRGRWRDAFIASAFGLVLLVASVALAPDAWRQFIDTLAGRGPGDISGFLPIPYFVRLAVGLALTVIASRLEPRFGEPLMIIAVTVALPTLWFTALSTLAALVPLLRNPAPRNLAPGSPAVA